MQQRQNEIKRILDGSMIVCQTALVEQALGAKLFETVSIQNLYRPFDGKLIKPNTCKMCIREFNVLDSETGACQECYEENSYPQEVLEWWLVAPWFGNKLSVEGEPVLSTEYGMWWGRCTTGQDVSLDYVIQKIYDDIKYKE